MITVWVYIAICLDSPWRCLPEHNRWGQNTYSSQQECYEAAAREMKYVLSRGWKVFCIEGRANAPQ